MDKQEKLKKIREIANPESRDPFDFVSKMKAARSVQKGDKGDKGDQGEKGDAGPEGKQGLKGEQGPEGRQGLGGPEGKQGLKGLEGRVGPMGPEGKRGPKGDKGDKALALDTQKFKDEIYDELKKKPIAEIGDVKDLVKFLRGGGFRGGGGDTVAAGTNIAITTNASGQKVISSTLPVLAGVTSLNGLTGDITLAAGSNITLTPVGNTITIAASGGGGGSSPLTTKGDLYTFSTVDARLPVGASGYVLSADNSTATGLKWVASSQILAIGNPVGGSLPSAILYIDGAGDLAQDTTNLVYDYVNGRVGIGVGSPGATLDIASSSTSSIGVAVEIIQTYTPSGSGTAYALLLQASVPGSSSGTAAVHTVGLRFTGQNSRNIAGSAIDDTQTTYGFYAQATADGTISATLLVTGFEQRISNLLTSTDGTTFTSLKGTSTLIGVDTAVSLAATYNNNSGVFTANVYGFKANISSFPAVVGSSTVTVNNYGVYVDVIGSSGGVSTGYGVYINSVISSDTNWGLYSPTTVAHTLAGNLILGIAATQTGKLQLTGTTSGVVTLSVVDAAGTWTMKLPTSAGTSGYVLQTDGSGNTSWIAAGGGGMTNPMTTLGDIIYEDATPQPARLAGNTTTTKKFLRQTGTGAISAAPAWDTIVAGDIPTATLVGTSNQVVLSASGAGVLVGATNITLSLPQDIATASTPQFGGLGINAAASSSAFLLHGAATTGKSSQRMPAGTAPTSPVEGDLWNDSTQKANMSYIDAVKQALMGCIFTQTADKTVSNTTTETTIFGTGVGTLTLPASFFVVGKTTRIHIEGLMSFPYPPPLPAPTLTIKVKYGSTVVATVVNGATPANGGWFCIDVDITCRTTGSSGTVETAGHWIYETTVGGMGGDPLNNAGATTTINTTTSNALDITATWSTADVNNIITSTISSIIILN